MALRDRKEDVAAQVRNYGIYSLNSLIVYIVVILFKIVNERNTGVSISSGGPQGTRSTVRSVVANIVDHTSVNRSSRRGDSEPSGLGSLPEYDVRITVHTV
jgi:hypothetical protein